MERATKSGGRGKYNDKYNDNDKETLDRYMDKRFVKIWQTQANVIRVEGHLCWYG